MKYRYPGVKPFEEDDSLLFFGRDEDIDNLYNLVLTEKLIVLYSKSGLGKSSLLNAGLFPKLKKTSQTYPISVRFGGFISNAKSNLSPIDIFTEIIKNETSKITSQTLIDKIIAEEGSIWYYFKKLQLNVITELNKLQADWSISKRTQNPSFIIIFDQFEEIFTYPEKDVNALKQQLSDLFNSTMPQIFQDALKTKLKSESKTFTEAETNLLYLPLNVKLLFAIRSDKMSLMQRMTDFFPNILRTSYELAALNAEQAEDAILIPANYNKESYISPPFKITDDALELIIQSLTKTSEKRIESFQLQILCRYVETLVINAAKNGNILPIENKKYLITSENLGDVSNIYENYYYNLLESLGSDNEKNAARELIEDGLIFEADARRISLYEGQILRDYKISKNLLKKLVDSHLLRVETRNNQDFYYEISHDTLVAPILNAKLVRKERDRQLEENLQREAEMQKMKAEKQRIEKEHEKAEKKNKMLVRVVVLPSLFLVIVIGILFNTNYNVSEKFRNAQSMLKNSQENMTTMQQQLDTVQESFKKYKGILRFIRNMGLVYGTVRDEKGQPIADADIIFDEYDRTKSDDDGNFLLKVTLDPNIITISIKAFKEGFWISKDTKYDLEKNDIVIIKLKKKE